MALDNCRQHDSSLNSREKRRAPIPQLSGLVLRACRGALASHDLPNTRLLRKHGAKPLPCLSRPIPCVTENQPLQHLAMASENEALAAMRGRQAAFRRFLTLRVGSACWTLACGNQGGQSSGPAAKPERASSMHSLLGRRV